MNDLEIYSWRAPARATLVAIAVLSAHHAANAQTIPKGVWRSDAYAEIWLVADSTYTLYAATKISCLRMESGPVSDYTPLYAFRLTSDTRMAISSPVISYSAERLATVPENCESEPQPVTPRRTFAVFAQYFRENYPFFKRRGLDWESIVTTYGARITDSMPESALYATLGEIVRLIDDPHVFVGNRKPGPENLRIGAPSLRGAAKSVSLAQPGRTRAFYVESGQKIDQAIETLVCYEMLHGRCSSALNGKFIWGRLSRDVGYLRLNSFAGLFPDGLDTDAASAVLDSTLDVIFKSFEGAHGIVIDLSTNTGGADRIPFAIARRLIGRPVVAYRRQEMTANGLTHPYDVSLSPSPRVGFRGRVVLMMSSKSLSAGETLGIVLQGLPGVTVVGENSGGAHSDILQVPLPNGGTLGLPNQINATHSGVSREVSGIVPDVRSAPYPPLAPVSGFQRMIVIATRLALASGGPWKR